MSNPKGEEVVSVEAKGGNLLLSDRNNSSSGAGNSYSDRLTHSSPGAAYEQVNAINRKLTAANDYCKSNELNNNSITQQEFHSNFLASSNKMEDSNNRKSAKPPSSPSAATTATLASTFESREAKSLEYPQLGNKDIPAYSSIFATPSTQTTLRSGSPPQPIAGKRNHNRMSPSGRPPLVKQEETDIPVAKAISGLAASNKELAAFNYSNRSKSRPSEEDEAEDDDIDERLPFNSNTRSSQQRATRHSLPESHRCKSPHVLNYSKQTCLASYDNQCDMAHHPHNKLNHTKISFNDSRPPSFGVCHSKGYNDVEASIDRSRETGCQKCDCNECFKNRKLTLLDTSHHHSSIDSNHTNQPFKYDRTKTLHLVLKSIVLVLLTILLLIFLIAILVASHYLPQALERIMNATRSFNVTIAG